MENKEMNKADLIGHIVYYFSLITGLNIDNLEETDFEALTENLNKLHYIELQNLYETLKPLCKAHYL